MRLSTGLCWLFALCLAGCQDFEVRRPFDAFRSRTADNEARADDFDTKVETPMVGDYATVQGNRFIVLYGVGLVMGLNGNGGDPPPRPSGPRCWKT